ncbi:MAG: hypothetical protein PHD81_02560 [Candidatus Nanoarchaeia archaeon]|nr:hypothetical protein [Candidatus Nanoarchaeia archaeon]MDD5587968.1 hypothetical protein [Candidatus Nanoarchaeia archaeon]
MGQLFLDDFIREQGFNSTEEYIYCRLEEQSALYFQSLDHYKNLFENGLIKEGMVIRTSDRGLIDRTYSVDNQGNLVGITSGTYPGENGIFKPEEILVGNRISDGWTIESPRLFGKLFQEWRLKQ